jgi:hypothetical protein
MPRKRDAILKAAAARTKPHKPLTDDEARQFRRLIRKTGRGHWLPVLWPDLLPRKRGRHERDSDTDAMLANIEVFVRTAMREREMSRDAALHWAFDSTYENLKKLDADSVFVARFGPNANALVARLRRKLRKGGFDKRDIKALVPPEWLEAGIDPEKFTTKTDKSI